MQPKYHHLIPQTYLSAWANTSGTLKIKWLSSGKTESRNTDSVAGIKHYHSIIAGMPFCTKEDTEYFFSILNPYKVEYNGNQLVDAFEMNKYYGVFDDWAITRNDGSPVSKKALKSNIDKLRINDIEILWSQKYENKWNSVRKLIEQKVSSNVTSVPRFYFGYLMRFFVSLDWRSLQTNQQFTDAYNVLAEKIIGLDKISIPKDERELPIFETASDYVRHCLLLYYYRQFFHNEGLIHTCVKLNMQNTSFRFYIATGEDCFITSDNPSFTYFRKDGQKEGIMPITPKILLAQGKNTTSDNNYYVTKIGKETIRLYNNIIEENASQFIAFDNSKP